MKEKTDRILNEYRKILSVDEEKDLKKFNSSERLIYIPKSINKKLVISGITFIMVIALFFAVFYPIIMRNHSSTIPTETPTANPTDTSSPTVSPSESPDDGVPHYFDSGELEYITIDSVDSFNAEYNCNVRTIAITEYLGSLTRKIIFRENNSVIGIRQSFSIHNEQIREITVCAFINNNYVDNLNFYNLPYEKTWDNVTVKYNIITDNYVLYYHYIQFEQDGVLYNISISCYEEMDISVLLDQIFG